MEASSETNAEDDTPKVAAKDSTHAEAVNEGSTTMKAAMIEGTDVESSPEVEGITTPEVAVVRSTTLEDTTEVSTTRKTTAVKAVAGRAVMTGGGSELETVTEAAAMEVAIAAVEEDTDEENKFGEVEPSGNGTGVIVSSNLGLKPCGKLMFKSSPKVERGEDLVCRSR